MKTHKPLHKKTGTASLLPAQKPSRRRLWVFRIMTVLLVPALFLGILEGGLRLFGVGYSTQAIVKYNLDEKEIYGHNYKFGWRFFPRNIARNFDGFVFDSPKPPHTCRIFVLGESAAMGMPAPAYNFGRILKVMLEEQYPDTHFEVHTAAMVAINSHAVLEIAKDCAEYDPDLFIVYMGNNEVVGPFGPGTVFSPLLPSVSLIRANLAIKATRTGQLLERLLNAIKTRGKTLQRWGGLEMFLEKQVRYDSAALGQVYHHFEKNLRDICQAARRNGARVIVSTIGVNLKDSPPFASLHRDGLTDTEKQTWETLYQEGVIHETAGEGEQAIEKYRAAGQIDDTFADLQFRLGRAYGLAGDSATAEEHYLNACRYDTLRFRADGRINEIIRSVADQRESEGVYFVDGAAALKENSPHKIPGAEFFYEHVHLNFKGNYVLAAALLPTVQKSVPLPPVPPTSSVLTEELAAQRLAYTNFERHDFLNRLFLKMLSRPPFTHQLYHDEFMKATERQIQQVLVQSSGMNDCLQQYKNALQRNPNDWQLLWQYAAFLGAGLNDSKAQEEQLRKVIRLCPYDAAYLSLGKNLHRQGKLKEAMEILTALLDFKANDGSANIELASMYGQLRNTEKYIEHLSIGLSIDPTSSIEPYGALAEAYEQSGKPDKAIQTLYRAIKIFPEAETAPAHATLGYMLNTQGDYEKAMEEFKLALKINPDFENDNLFKSLMTNLETKVKQ